MPPKRWGRLPMMSSAESHKTELICYIKKEIENNNFLGLVGEELENMASTLATCSSKRELFDWCQTLMIGEVVAAEVTKRRINKGPPFDDSAAASLNTTFTASSGSKEGGGGRQLTVATKKGARKRGVLLSKTKEGSKLTAVLKPGFFECGCFATKHNLRGNCANCGRIICEQESGETCYNCDLDPSTCVAYEIVVQEGLLNEAAVEKNRKDYEAAVAKRDKLLQYAETRTKRTKVIDDQTAVFLSPKHAWMSVEERKKADEDEALAERRRKVAAMHRATGAYTVHLDIMNQNVSLGCTEVQLEARSSDVSSHASLSNAEEEDDKVLEEEEGETRALPLPSLMRKIWYSLDGNVDNVSTTTSVSTVGKAEEMTVKKPMGRHVVELSRRVQQDYYKDDVHLFLNALRERSNEDLHIVSDGLDTVDNEVNMKKEEVTTAAVGRSTEGEETAALTRQPSDIVDRLAPTPTMRLNDDGICLSMHQPWASLLVAGIKVHEGRVWSTEYRGRLWIHAASAQPHDIAEVEKHYAKYMTSTQRFPKHYPTRVLLGYVYLVDCMDRDTYERIFEERQRQEESPYLFICAEAKMLPFPLAMDGNHKLFRMDHKVHTAARKQLMEIV